MVLTIALLIVGLVLIIKGGDVFVDAASWVAEKTGIPKLIIGATVVSLATTLPEQLVSFMAAAGGKVDMAIGNAIGSVTVNIGLIMGIALIFLPSVVKRKEYLFQSLLMLSAALIIMLFGFSGEIGLIPSLLLIAIFVLFMADNIKGALSAMKHNKNASPQSGDIKALEGDMAFSVAPDAQISSGGSAALEVSATPAGREIALNIAKFVFGALALVIGSRLLVDNGSELAALLGVSERIIAVSVVAIGTSLPELVTTITAISKKQGALSVGNIIGANIIDLALILPISSLISGSALPVSSRFAMFDIPACLIIGCIAILPMLISKKFRRSQGVVMVVLYIAYLVITTTVLG
ncbi:calcium/sodium antiporter [Christensenellaceae bacterium OttesenSCG-928-M15]|nr:calcium/sodium antiporter [Christensenellaceae bacterium OttesenSCG-928-M15]